MMKNIMIFSFILIITIGLAGCGVRKNSVPSAIVDIKDIKTEQIIESLNSTGRITAKYDVAVVARVDGYLEKKYFAEGSFVKKGDLLYQIEPYTYSAKVNQAAANLRNAQASLRDSSKNLTRAAQLVKDDYISKADYDNKLAIRDQDRANVDSTKAALTQAQINLGYTKIHSPITGKIGKIFITEGNYVTPSSGTLATIVSLDPIQVDFTLKSKSYLALKKASKVDDLSDISVEITLSDDSIYPEKGKIEFIDNTIDETAGTIQVRAIFNNKNNLLIPGDYVTAKIILDKPREVIMVPQEAVIQTETGKFLYVIDDENKAFKRDIVAEEDYKGNWIVTEGLTDGEKIAVTGLQYIQEGQKVIINQQAKADKNAKKDIKPVGKPSFFQKVSNKIKRSIKKVMGK